MIAFAVVAALRMLGYVGKIIQSVAEEYQDELAVVLGANATMRIDTPRTLVEKISNVKRMPSLFGSILMGGAGLTFDCIASNTSIDQALSLTREGGRVVLVGIQSAAQISLSHVIARGKEISGSFSVGWDDYNGESRRTFDIALELLSNTDVPIEEVITHYFPLSKWREAFDANLQRSKTRSVKTILYSPS